MVDLSRIVSMLERKRQESLQQLDAVRQVRDRRARRRAGRRRRCRDRRRPTDGRGAGQHEPAARSNARQADACSRRGSQRGARDRAAEGTEAREAAAGREREMPDDSLLPASAAQRAQQPPRLVKKPRERPWAMRCSIGTGRSWKDGTRTHIFLADVASGVVRDVTPGNVDSPTFQLGGPIQYGFAPTAPSCASSPITIPQPALSTNNDLWLLSLDEARRPSPATSRPATPRTMAAPSTRATAATSATARRSSPGTSRTCSASRSTSEPPESPKCSRSPFAIG